MAAIEEVRVEVEGVGVFVRRLGGEGVPTVFAHGNPTHSGDWLPFLERMSGPAITFDFPGWGESDDPSPRRFDYSMHGLADFFVRCLDVLGVDRYRLVVHDWGVVALIAAQAAPDRVDRLVVFNTVPILPGYRWHWIARYAWRVPVVGELTNLLTTKAALRLISRQATPAPGGMPDEFIDNTWRHYRRGRWRPMLVLYRSADPGALAAAGSRLGQLRGPALVVWPRSDPYLPSRFGRMYAERLPDAELVELDEAGHWPWLDRPDVIPRVIEFLERA